MIVRNSSVIARESKFGFIDKADFEEVEGDGPKAIQNRIDKQLEGTSVTVLLIGKNTHLIKWVKYEIEKSINRGNGILTIDISKIPSWNDSVSDCCDLRISGYPHYQWNNGNGRANLGSWVGIAATNAGK